MVTTMQEVTRLYSLDEAAGQLGGVSTWTLRKHLSRGSIKVTRLGRRVFLSASEIERIQREGLPSLTAATKESNGTNK
jgi:hypothetical protein